VGVAAWVDELMAVVTVVMSAAAMVVGTTSFAPTLGDALGDALADTLNPAPEAGWCRGSSSSSSVAFGGEATPRNKSF
jgi:hypothetical protein